MECGNSYMFWINFNIYSACFSFYNVSINCCIIYNVKCLYVFINFNLIAF